MLRVDMMGLDRQKIIRTLRLSLTCIFLFLMTWYYQVPESAWSLITIFFVMYEYDTVGGVFRKSVLRFTGTTLSAVYGVIVAVQTPTHKRNLLKKSVNAI